MNRKKQSVDSPVIKMHVWLEKNDGVYFGQGRYELLLKIEELGSLKLAAEAMGISYRGAWGKIKKTEAIIGEKLIEKESNKEGYRLTEFGKKFMEEFSTLHKDILEFAEKRCSDMMSRVFRGSQS